MNKLFLFALAILVTYATQAQQGKDWANFGKYAEANKNVPADAVVFMGNSITEGWVNTHPQFFTQNKFVGRGISGQVSSQMLVRFRRDVIDLKPRAVVILAGTNDIAQNNGYISLKNTLGNIISMCELAKAHNIKVVLCSVLPAYQFGWRKELNPAPEIIALNQSLRNYADRNKIVYVDFHSALKDERNGLPDKYAKDGVHPTPEAYEIMENMVKAGLDKALKKKGKDKEFLFSR
jgi:lysophospholipase L1-like esterase